MENIKNYFRKTRNYMLAYVEDIARGNELEDKRKGIKKITSRIEGQACTVFLNNFSVIILYLWCIVLCYFLANLLR